jgi:DNA-binding LytR/AlgR family response regulator
MPTALIADDELQLAQDLAQRLRACWPQLDVVAVVGNGLQAVAELGRLHPGFAFLDIRMPGLTGIEVARAAQHTRVVFVTAFDEYAVAAFDAAAVDYLLKPVSDTRLARCVLRLQQQPGPPADIRALSDCLVQEKRTELAWLTVGLANTTRLISTREVIYFQASDKYTELVTARERHLLRTSLKELFNRLDPRQFVQIHRGTIVNLNAVERVERDVLGRSLVYLKEHPDVLRLSRAFAGQFRQM